MKKLILLTIFLFLFIPLVTSEACSDQNEIDVGDIPCEALTQVITCEGNISVLNLNTSIQTNVTTLIKVNQSGTTGIYNFSFNFSEASYSLLDCGNNTATILVGDFPRDDLWKTAIMLGLLGIAGILVGMGKFIFENEMWMVKSLLYGAAAFLVVIAVDIALVLSRTDNIKAIVTTSLVIGIVFLSVFVAYLLIFFTISMVNAVKNSKDN